MRRRKKLSRSTKKKEKRRDRPTMMSGEEALSQRDLFCYSYSSFFAPGQILLLFISPSSSDPTHAYTTMLLAPRRAMEEEGDTFLCTCATDSHKKMRDQKAGEASFFVSFWVKTCV